MNLYLIKARRSVGYDAYDGHVVRAWTAHDARRNVPHGDEVGWTQPPDRPDFWTNDETSLCVKIGTTDPDAPRETMCLLSSFNAG